ncbi:MAG: damage-inducible protein DinB [Firmicutes bacterium]|nr:damage-inducible protein DinB [Bacillota bacterium]
MHGSQVFRGQAAKYLRLRATSGEVTALNPFPYHEHPLTVLEAELAHLSADRLTWRPAAGRNSIGWLLAHMLGTEDFWVHQLAYGAPVAHPVPQEDAGALLAEYRRVREETDTRLAVATGEGLERLVTVPAFSDGWTPPCPPTVHWVFHHVFEHELYHIGQVSLLLRQQGLAPLPF